MAESVEVAVIGAGQAGLSLSYELTHAGIEHVVLERARVGESWRRRWDSFCLVTPNWSMRLPGGQYDGDDPDGFMARDEIVDHFVRYAERFAAPVRAGVDVRALQRDGSDGFRLRTTSGDIRAAQVVVASGAFQKPHRPPHAGRFPAGLHVIDAAEYANPHALPPGNVLIVGSGQTGCQLAEELFDAGRDVFMACGRVPWIPRRIGDADFVEWLMRTSFLEATLADLPSPLARFGGNIQSTGRGGGHDLHYRTLQAMGVVLLGHLVGIEDGRAHFARDLGESVAFGDARYMDLCTLIRKTCAEQGLVAPEMPTPRSFAADAREYVDLHGFGAVMFASGYRPDYTHWVEFPDAFDDMGFPIQADGTSVPVPGLHFMGVHFQRKRKSASLLGVAEDAAVLADRIATNDERAHRGRRVARG
jgi:putative flavoprotein involved in K+ transport